MRITPFRVLEEHARKEYQARFASAPEPRVINARALVSLLSAAPRSFIWGGIGYWCPSLSYEDGARLLVAANALRDLHRRGDATALARGHLTAAGIVRTVVRSRRPLWRLTRAFYRDTPEQIETLARWLLHVDDESTIVPTEKPVTIDLVDNVYIFEGHFHRRPCSWADYVHGMRHINRAASRTDLRSAFAARIGVNADNYKWRNFDRELRAMAGWN